MSIEKVLNEFKKTIEESVSQHRQVMGNLSSLTDTAHRFGFVEALEGALKLLSKIVSNCSPVCGAVMDDAADAVEAVTEILSPASHDQN